MTIAIAITGKSGSGKTTLVKAIMNALNKKYPKKSMLLFDNDLGCELGHSFGLDIRNTIYGIRAGKHEYKTGIPANMSKTEYIEWALEDIVVGLKENVDIVVSWLIGSKDCRCPITSQLNDSLIKLIKCYDIVIFDCEFDLKYLHQLVEFPIDATLIVAEPSQESVHLASRIMESSEKYAVGGQMGVVINKVKTEGMKAEIPAMLNQYGLEILGTLPFIEDLDGVKKESEILEGSITELLFRLNIPIE